MFIQLHQPDQNEHEMHKTWITHSRFIVSCGNTPVIPDFLEKIFDPAPFFILPPVYIPWFGCIRFSWDTVRCSRFFDLYPKVCRSIRFVCHDNRTGHIHMLQKIICHCDITDLAAVNLSLRSKSLELSAKYVDKTA